MHDDISGQSTVRISFVFVSPSASSPFFTLLPVFSGHRRLCYQPENCARVEEVPSEVQQDARRPRGLSGAAAAGGSVRQGVRERQQQRQQRPDGG